MDLNFGIHIYMMILLPTVVAPCSIDMDWWALLLVYIFLLLKPLKYTIIQNNLSGIRMAKALDGLAPSFPNL